MTKPQVTAFHFSCAVLGVKRTATGGLSLEGEIRGTAFPIGGDWMMTAGHVAASFATDDQLIPVVLVYGPDGHFHPVIVSSSEILSGDIALLQLDPGTRQSAEWQPRIKWGTRRFVGLERTRAIGYAYGLSRIDDRTSIVSRAFEGVLTARLSRFRPIGSSLEPFPVYELPFPAPRGLSGSPLLSAKGQILVRGVMIGNSQSKMLVHSSEEVVKETGSSTIVEQYETLTLGVATDGVYIQGQHAPALGRTVGEHLEAHGLIIREDPLDQSGGDA